MIQNQKDIFDQEAHNSVSVCIFILSSILVLGMHSTPSQVVLKKYSRKLYLLFSLLNKFSMSVFWHCK
jgi:hypothetical protein